MEALASKDINTSYFCLAGYSIVTWPTQLQREAGRRSLAGRFLAKMVPMAETSQAWPTTPRADHHPLSSGVTSGTHFLFGPQKSRLEPFWGKTTAYAPHLRVVSIKQVAHSSWVSSHMLGLHPAQCVGHPLCHLLRETDRCHEVKCLRQKTLLRSGPLRRPPIVPGGRGYLTRRRSQQP